MSSSLRSVRLLFTGVTTYNDLQKVLEQIHTLGTPLSLDFNYEGSGHGTATVQTELTNRELEVQLAEVLPQMITGVVDLKEGNDHGHTEMAS